MKRLFLLTTVAAIFISSSSLGYATTNSPGGTITFTGYIYEPQCEVKLTNKTDVNVQCFRNGKNESVKASLKNGRKLESDYVKVEYDKFSKLPMLNITYE